MSVSELLPGGTGSHAWALPISLQWEHVLLAKYCIVQASNGTEHSLSEEPMNC